MRTIYSAMGFSGDGGPAVSAQLSGLAVNADYGDLFTADTGNHRLRRQRHCPRRAACKRRHRPNFSWNKVSSSGTIEAPNREATKEPMFTSSLGALFVLSIHSLPRQVWL